MERQRSPKLEPPATTCGPRRSEIRFAAGTVEGPPIAADARELREEDVAQLVHDLRDPLATIALETYVLDRKLANGDQSDARCTIARIIRNVEFLDRIVQDLVDSCAIGEGQFEIHRRPTDLRALLEQVIARVVSTRDCGRVILDAPFPITMPIDDLRIQRVVANLIGNALKYAPKSSGIVVQLEAGALAAQISVTDTGPGLSAAEMEYIFEKYRRGAGARGVQGHGLGLYVSKLIVESHGGKIGVERAGAGSRFYFELPMIST